MSLSDRHFRRLLPPWHPRSERANERVNDHDQSILPGLKVVVLVTSHHARTHSIKLIFVIKFCFKCHHNLFLLIMCCVCCYRIFHMHFIQISHIIIIAEAITWKLANYLKSRSQWLWTIRLASRRYGSNLIVCALSPLIALNKNIFWIEWKWKRLTHGDYKNMANGLVVSKSHQKALVNVNIFFWWNWVVERWWFFLFFDWHSHFYRKITAVSDMAAVVMALFVTQIHVCAIAIAAPAFNDTIKSLVTT